MALLLFCLLILQRNFSCNSFLSIFLKFWSISTYAIIFCPVLNYMLTGENLWNIVRNTNCLSRSLAMLPIILIALLLLCKFFVVYCIFALACKLYSLEDIGFLPHNHPEYKQVITCGNFWRYMGEVMLIVHSV